MRLVSASTDDAVVCNSYVACGLIMAYLSGRDEEQYHPEQEERCWGESVICEELDHVYTY